MDNIDVDKLDWNLLWKQAKTKKTWKSKKAADWDKKAAAFAKRTSSSIYIKLFLKLLNPQSTWSVLDAGCGPGTLALPLAKRVRRISALDFSGNMLEILSQKASARDLKNISTYHCSWEDDWQEQGIGRHDVAIASRSLAVSDLKAALVKLTAHAREKVIITDRVGHGPLDPDAFAAVGRPLITGPDYIYTINLIHQMGYLPKLDYIELERKIHYSDEQEALQSYLWMFRNPDADEIKRLTDFLRSISSLHADGSITVHRKHPPVWAFISWNPANHEKKIIKRNI